MKSILKFMPSLLKNRACEARRRCDATLLEFNQQIGELTSKKQGFIWGWARIMDVQYSFACKWKSQWAITLLGIKWQEGITMEKGDRCDIHGIPYAE